MRFPHNDKFDAQVRASEERIANWFAENRKVTDTFYELLDFTKKHKRMPKKEHSSYEKDFYMRLEKANIISKIKEHPQYYEVFLDKEVYRQLTEQNSL